MVSLSIHCKQGADLGTYMACALGFCLALYVISQEPKLKGGKLSKRTVPVRMWKMDKLMANEPCLQSEEKERRDLDDHFYLFTFFSLV